jgi:pSer/pThr/pTyr-binding forkhead associated (FHA) protein
MPILAQLVDDVVVHKFELDKTEMHLGRHPDNDIVIDDSAVSARHASIFLQVDRHFPEYQEIYIEDLGSTNGTFVNELKLTGRQRLHHQDVVRLAWNQFKIIDLHEVELGATVHIVRGDKFKF